MKKKVIHSFAKYEQKVNAFLQDLQAVSDEDANRKPADGGWSAMQTVVHLIMAEEGSLAYVNKKIGFGAQFDPVTFNTYVRYYLLDLALALPIKFKAPAVSDPAKAENLPDFIPVKKVVERWEKILSDWRDFYENMPDDLSGKAVFKHPRAGKIGFMQTISFFDTHFERHRKQIKRALGK